MPRKFASVPVRVIFMKIRCTPASSTAFNPIVKINFLHMVNRLATITCDIHFCPFVKTGILFIFSDIISKSRSQQLFVQSRAAFDERIGRKK